MSWICRVRSARVFSILCCAAFLVTLQPDTGRGSGGIGSSTPPANLLSNDMFSSIPADYFIENMGQLSNRDVLFYTTSGDMQIGFAESAVLIKLVEHGSAPAARPGIGRELTLSSPPEPEPPRGVLLRLDFEGANKATPLGRDVLLFPTSFFIGNDPALWHTNVKSYREIVYEGLYDGIDLVYRATGRGVKYDFVAAPGTDLSAVKISYEGADGVELDAAGNVVVHTAVGDIVDSSPVAYQGGDDAQCSFAMLGPWSYGFTCTSVDRFRELVVDPLIYSTYLGGASEDMAYSIAVDSAGNAYVTGYTESADFPTTPGVIGTAKNGFSDAFVTKLDSTGTSLLYSTYLGGSFYEMTLSIALDSLGNAYVTGNTGSSDFPVTPGAFDTTLNGSQDGFVAKLNSTGSSLLYSTYLGGGGSDTGVSIAADSLGNAFVTGDGDSTDFPVTPGAFDATYNGGLHDAFVTVFDPTGSSLLYSTYLGGDGDDRGASIAASPAGNAYATGYTSSATFPTTPGALDTSYNGGTFDAFVAAFNVTSTSLPYSTFLGGGMDDYGFAIVADPDGSVYIAGITLSMDFPATPGAFDTASDGTYDAFVAKLNSTGDSLIYATYLGGNGEDDAVSVAVSPAGNVYVSGLTGSTDFPVTFNAFDTTYGGTGDGFVTALNATGSSLLYSTYLGDVGYDSANSVAMDSFGLAYLTGFTSGAFPTTPGAFDTTYNGGSYDAFVAKLVVINAPPIASNLGVQGFTSPPNILHITDFTPDLNWTYTDPEGDPQAWYDLRVGTATGLGDIWDPPATSGTATVVTYGGAPLLRGTDYYFGVKVNDSLLWSSEAEVMFHVNSIPYPPTIPITPAQYSTVPASPSQTVSWTTGGDNESDVITYEWQVSTDTSFISTVAQGNTTSTTSASFSTNPSTSYYWRVRARDDYEPTMWSAYGNTPPGYWTFNTSSPPNTPPVIAITYPVGGEVLTQGSPQIVTWVAFDNEDVLSALLVWINYTSSAGSGSVCGPVAGNIGSCPWILPLITAIDVVVNGTVIDTGGLKGYDESGQFTIQAPPPNTPPTITITFPSGGETWIQGSSHTVSWTAFDNEDAQSALIVWVNYTSGAGNGNICGPVAGVVGSCMWVLPSITATDVVVNGTVVDTGGLKGYDESGPFTIEAPPPPNTPPTITIASPVGGEVWMQGSYRDVTWTASDSEDAPPDLLVWINYTSSAGSGNICGPVAGNVGTCAWTLPTIAATDVVVNGTAIDTGGLKGYDDSGPFTIQAPPPPNTPPTITITSPVGGEVFQWGDSPTVTWTGSDAQDLPTALTFWVNYTSSAGNGVICGPVIGVLSCAWSVPSIAATNVVVNGTVTDTGGLKGYDDSGPFTIKPPPPVNTPPTVTITSPTGGEEFVKGSSHTITWTMHDDEDVNANLTVYINYTTGGITSQVVAALKGELFFTWILPSTEASDVVVNITVIDTGDLKNWSQSGPFTIKGQPSSPPGAETNYKPFVAAVFAVVLAAVGFWSSKKKPWKGGKDKMAVVKAFSVFSLPFVAAEVATGLVSFMTGYLSIPPSVGIGTAVDLLILTMGLVTVVVNLRWKEKAKRGTTGPL